MTDGIVIKSGSTTLLTLANVVGLTGSTKKRMEEEDIPGQTLLDYYDPKTQDRPISFNGDIIHSASNLITTISGLETAFEDDSTLFTIIITLNSTTMTKYCILESFDWTIVSINTANLKFEFKEANSVMQI